MIVTPDQCRAARNWLGWSREELAERARIGRNTVVRFEGGRELHESTRHALLSCFEREGIRFPDPDTIKRTREARA